MTAPSTRISNSTFAVAIGLMLSAAFALSLVALVGKELTGLATLPVVMLLRFLVPCLVLSWIAFVLFDQPLAIKSWGAHVARAVFAFAAQVCLFAYLSEGSVLIGTLLFSTSGLFLPFVTRLAYGMEIKPRTLLAIAVSFVGVAFILDPVGGVAPIALVGLLSGLFGACSQATMHRASKASSPLAASLVMFAICSVFSLVWVVAAGDVQTLAALAGGTGGAQGHAALVLIAFSVATLSNQALRLKAYKRVNKPGSLAPFYYAAIVFSGVWDFVFYGHVPGVHVYIGVALVGLGGIIMTRRGPAPAHHAPADTPA